jgi:hypothetical protein
MKPKQGSQMRLARNYRAVGRNAGPVRFDPSVMPILLLRCGCAREFREGLDQTVCGTQCLPHGWSRVVGMPPPRFRGVARGPHVQTTDLAPHTGRLIEGPPSRQETGMADHPLEFRSFRVRRTRRSGRPRRESTLGAGRTDLAQAYKILSLRLPTVVGAQAPTPASNLTAAGSSGSSLPGGLDPYAALFQALLKSR